MRRLILFPALLYAGMASADPFESCTSDAYLTQSAVATTYGVNLSTGEYTLVQNDMGTKGKVNATGFNPNDNYVYGWSNVHNVPARFGSDWQVEPLAVDNIAGKTFFVGDVSLLTNEYVVYRRGASTGLYAIGLDPANTETYLQMRLIVDGATMNLRIFDLAFHPSDGFAYSVDNKGLLHQIDVTNGTSIELGDTGESGTFGAVYFDVNGQLYISRNKDGRIFRIDIDGANYSAELFARGPASSINDGARCALADILDDTNTEIDFGDAPASYGTLLSDNGARHGLAGGATLFLGDDVDGESNGTPFPMSDDEIDGNNDDDGVQFATGLLAGSQAVLLVSASDTGYLNAWIDTNQNGEFDSNEQIVGDRLVGAGSNTVFISLPEDAIVGKTWARFRLSSDAGVGPAGGVSNGEVEDYEVDITADGASVTYYPSSDDWATIAYEDNWPIEGDYDMNDLVVYLRTAVYRQDGLVTFLNISGEIAAVGAAYQNGFGIRLPGVLRSQIDENRLEYTINDLPTAPYNPLESGPNEAIFMLMYNVWNYVSAGEDCTFYRTEIGCGSNIQARFNINIPLLEPVEMSTSGVFDPFMFATPGAWHGSHYSENPGRRYEIHLKNQAPTESFDFGLASVDIGVDASDPLSELWFQTEDGMPWALEIGTRWEYPREFIDVLFAYPAFEAFVNSNGESGHSWYLPENSNPNLVFTE